MDMTGLHYLAATLAVADRNKASAARFEWGTVVAAAGSKPSVILDSDAEQVAREVTDTAAGAVPVGSRVLCIYHGQRLTLLAAPGITQQVSSRVQSGRTLLAFAEGSNISEQKTITITGYGSAPRAVASIGTAARGYKVDVVETTPTSVTLRADRNDTVSLGAVEMPVNWIAHL